MTVEATTRSPLLRFALEGARVRKAATVLERESSRLTAALRRAVPFLAKRGVQVALAQARAMPMQDLLESLTRPVHITHLVVTPGHAVGALLIDAGASALFLDGVLGGDGQSLPELNPAGLSGPQAALIMGLAGNIVRAFSSTLQASLGLQLEPRTGADEGHVESAPIVCVLELGEGDRIGHVALVLPREPLVAELGSCEAPTPVTDNPRIAAVLQDVELQLIVELGRVPLRVGRLASLKVGDTLRLDVPVSGLVSVRADGHELMRGRPTSTGGRIAVKIVPTPTTGVTRHEP